MQAVDEVVVLERIELIARLGVCYESQAKDKDIALIWISELVEEIKNGASSKNNQNASISQFIT